MLSVDSKELWIAGEIRAVSRELQEGKLEYITRRWWFFLLFIIMQVTTPPYASHGYKFPDEWSDVVTKIISSPIILTYANSHPVLKITFKIIPIILIVSIIIFKNKAARLFNIYVCIAYIIFAFGQSVAVTEKYGAAVCTLILVMFLIVAAFWAIEAVLVKNNFTPTRQSIWKYWVIVPAVLAFWYPLNPQTGRPDFNPAYLFTNAAGLAFCTMTPLYIGLLSLYYPRVNIATLRVTSLVGLIVGLYNMNQNFIVRPEVLWWNGVLHIPLLIISLYGLILSLRTRHHKKDGK